MKKRQVHNEFAILLESSGCLSSPILFFLFFSISLTDVVYQAIDDPLYLISLTQLSITPDLRDHYSVSLPVGTAVDYYEYLFLLLYPSCIRVSISR